ncbi:hypothetical protein BDZ91DRAFT_795643 [Kalaharituber pfeilii]|nr:hypothetical protein BDZ91DRAFT_795643 [Kalaharituber pfeilii]
MSTATPARKPTSTANRKSLIGTGAPPRSPTPSRDTLSSATNGTAGLIGRRHTVREGPLTNGHASQGSISSLRNGVSARSAVKRPSISGPVDDAQLLEKDAIISELRQKVAKLEANAEAAMESFTDQMKSLQTRMEEAIEEASKMEELLHSKDEVIEQLQNQEKDIQRSKREQENIYDAERMAWNQEKEELAEKEVELNTTIQRLKESLAQAQKERSVEEISSGHSRRMSIAGEYQQEDGVQFAPPSSSGSRTPPRNGSNNLLFQKDKIIQQLRLELAEAQIKVAEADHMGGSRVHDLEKTLMEVRMDNAKLMEENESFQLLLSQATLNGEFSRSDFMTNAFSDNPVGDGDEQDSDHDHPRRRKDMSRRNSVGLGSCLAHELEDLEDAEEAEHEHQRKLEAEIKSLKDHNKVMTIYINQILERLLEHKDFEAILDKTPSLGSIQAGQKESATAPPPPPAAEKPKGIFGRARSNTSKVAPQAPPTPPVNKPVPALPAPGHEPGLLYKAPSPSMRAGPTGLHHRRSESEAGAAAYTNGANVVNTTIPRALPRASTFASPTTPTSDRYTARPSKSRHSVASSASVGSSISDFSSEASSPTTSLGSGTGAISGKSLRPLTLVDGNVKSVEDKNRAKRSSWLGWFNRGKEEEPPSPTIVYEQKEVE